MKAALYIRVSTEDQLEYSPSAQKNALLEYAKRNGYTVAKENIYIDEGISGRKATARPAFMKMIKDAKIARPFDIILVHKFDRFARSREDSVIYKSILKKECDIKVVSISEQLEDDKFSVILEAMLEAMAEYYSLNLSEEVLKGMCEKAKRGGYQARAPLGYKMFAKALVIDDATKEIIKYIFDSYLKGEKTADIAKVLNDMGARTSKGLRFEKRSISYILNNPVYAGYISFEPKNMDDLLVEGLHENIISKEMFSLAKKKLAKEYTARSKATKYHKHFLSGLLQCSSCCAPLVYNDAKRAFFQCSGYKKGICTSHYVPVAAIEKAVVKALTALFSYAAPPQFIENTSATLYKSQILKEKQALDRARDSYLIGIDTLLQYETAKKELLDRIDVLSAQVAMSSQIKCDHINTLIEGADTDALKIIAKSAIEKIIYDKDTHTADIILAAIP